MYNGLNEEPENFVDPVNPREEAFKYLARIEGFDTSDPEVIDEIMILMELAKTYTALDHNSAIREAHTLDGLASLESDEEDTRP